MNTEIKEIVFRHKKGYIKRKDTMKELFDLDFWRKQESYKLIRQYCNKDDSVIEIGCLTGHHLLLLEEEEYQHLCGIEFLKGAIDWGKRQTKNIKFINDSFPSKKVKGMFFDKIICFDVLEHIHNLGEFLNEVRELMNVDSEVLVLVPKGTEFFDECHVNFYPNKESLDNLLSFYFHVVEYKEVDNNTKIFARCKL